MYHLMDNEMSTMMINLVTTYGSRAVAWMTRSHLRLLSSLLIESSSALSPAPPIALFLRAVVETLL